MHWSLICFFSTDNADVTHTLSQVLFTYPIMYNSLSAHCVHKNTYCQCYLDVVHTSTYHTETWLVDDIRHPHVIHMSSEGGYIIHTLFVILFIYPIIYNSVSAHSLHKRTLSMPCRCCPHMYT